MKGIQETRQADFMPTLRTVKTALLPWSTKTAHPGQGVR